MLKKNSTLKIKNPLFVLFVLLTLAGNIFPAENSGKKIFIYNFKQTHGKKTYRYFQSSLARSIRVVLKSGNKLTYEKKLKSRDTLIKQGYDFFIKGKYFVRKGKMHATFSVIELKKYMSVIVVLATGYPDTRIFDLIDAVSKIVNQTLKQPMSEILKKTMILKVTENGKVQNISDNLSGVNLSGMIFEGVNFSFKNLKKTNFSYCEIRNCTFNGADMREAKFKGSNIIFCDFNKADLKDTDFRDVYFYQITNFRKAKNKGDAEMSQANFDYLFTPKFQIGLTGNIGLALQYFKYADYVSETSEHEKGMTYNIGIKAIYYLTRNFGISMDAGYEYLLLKEKFTSGTLYEFKISNISIVLSALLRFKRVIISVGPYFSSTLDVKGFENSGSVFSNFGINIGVGYLIPIATRFDIMFSFETRACLIRRWYESNFGPLTNFYASLSFLYTAK